MEEEEERKRKKKIGGKRKMKKKRKRKKRRMKIRSYVRKAMSRSRGAQLLAGCSKECTKSAQLCSAQSYSISKLPTD